MFSNEVESSKPALFRPKFIVSNNCPPKAGGVGRKGLKPWQPTQAPSSKNYKLNVIKSRSEILDIPPGIGGNPSRHLITITTITGWYYWLFSNSCSTSTKMALGIL